MSLTTAQVVALNSTSIAALTSADIQSLTSAEIGLLNTTQVSALTTAEVADFTTTQVAALSPANSAALDTVGLNISTVTLPTILTDQPYSGTVLAVRGTGPYTWSAIGLPTNFTIGSSTGVISGTTSALGQYPVTITVTDSSTPYNEVCSNVLNLTVATPILVRKPNGTIYTAAPGSLIGANETILLA